MAAAGAPATVHICVVGDDGVGKTSLITAAATETFPDHPPPVLPPAKLPADTTPEGVPVVITDTSSRPEDKQALELACQEASVIVLCFSMDKPGTLRRVSSYWMPELRRLGVHVPVMLVGCKSDVRPADRSLHEAVLPIVKAYPQIETCMECSAKKLQFVGEVFYYALKAVVHPMAPLYEPERQALRPLCAKALKRIFLLCDKDQDGILNDAELNAFQVLCFNAPLQADELVGVKQVVAERIEQGIRDSGLTLQGFLFLHALFIERGRLETTWAVLRRFGYDNSLQLNEQLLSRVSFEHAPDQVVELTAAGRAFFASKFKELDADDDGCLSAREAEEMWSTAPGDPWATPDYAGLLVETSRKGLLCLPGFLAKWAYTTAADPRRTLAYAYYLGFPEDSDPSKLFQVSRSRRQERRADAPRRSVLQCYLFAPDGVDAAPVLEGLITQARPAHGTLATPIRAAAAFVGAEAGSGGSSSGSSGGSGVTLITRAVTDEQAQVLVESAQGREELQRCDVAAFLFDAQQPGSFRAARQRMLEVASAAGDALPCLFLQANDNEATQELADAIGEACSQLAVKPPASYSGARPGAPVYHAVVATAQQPELAIPETPSLKAARQYRRMLRKGALYTGAGIGVVLVGYLAWRFVSQQKQAAVGSEQGSSSSGGSSGDGSGSRGGDAGPAAME
ncbi:mitochondrial Rho GTPase 1-like isoform A [Chlorella sorokiniana]|uniref:Mitochondrial Rho GTPase n=1 Tax=Chlorella sorokiniana TaxID=3076 RepID=A0A2P6TV49_CHLSO|nr:mitochondrial Rho GTPase 1-like isoform A [Chlorella sorokiniana]|eukprot:PRW57931.1 mitochondrial Rho GTPase 1-like isoform A [Chlorella sorokiniana]